MYVPQRKQGYEEQGDWGKQENPDQMGATEAESPGPGGRWRRLGVSAF